MLIDVWNRHSGLITGGGDSVLCVWSDSTAEDEAAAMEAAQALVLEEQELFNRMAARDYERTVELCLKYVVDVDI